MSVVCQVAWSNRQFDDDIVLMAAAPEAGILRKNGAPQGRRPDTSQKAPRVRVEFPETWLWSESHTGYLPSDTCGNV